MDPELILAGLTLLEKAVEQEPALANELRAIFTSNATPADWQALRARVQAKTYRDFVPATQLPADASNAS